MRTRTVEVIAAATRGSRIAQAFAMSGSGVLLTGADEAAGVSGPVQ